MFNYYRSLVWFWISEHFERHHDREDLQQEIFLWVLVNVDRWPDSPRAFTRWLRAVCRNRCRMAIRERFAKKRKAEGREVKLDARISAVQREPTDPLLAEKLWASVDRLNPRNREAVVRFHVDGWTIGEIAKAQGVSRDGAKDRLERGRKLLSEQFR